MASFYGSGAGKLTSALISDALGFTPTLYSLVRDEATGVVSLEAVDSQEKMRSKKQTLVWFQIVDGVPTLKVKKDGSVYSFKGE